MFIAIGLTLSAKGVTQFLQQVTAEMAEAGFKLDEEPTTLFDQYLLIFKKVPRVV